MRQIVAVVAGVALAMAALGGAFATGFGLGAVVGAAGGGPGAVAGGLLPGGPERVLGGAGPDKIAVIRVVGPITREGFSGLPLGSAGAASRRIAALLERARRDAAVKAVIVELNTPGGSVVASDEITRGLQALRRARKVVVALMTEVAASGGYYVASGADHIVADPTTITGSIGVIVTLTNIQELSRKIGWRTIVFKSGAFKDLGNPTRPVTPQEAAILQGFVDEAYGRFVDVVAQGRRMDRARVRALADGRIYSGAQAHRLGLVDSLGGFTEAVDVARRRAGLADPLIVEYGGEGLLWTLLGSGGRRVRLWLGGPPLDELTAPQQPIAVQYLMAF
ncbi:MAG: signal peptide peptidase SppA [Armatimonadota bacterium]|nr:signal peptide peptidase SppA [Armatimonadota bacterium]MDR7423348.1 signal peptide peptidase SppA [Armatimonadota bacterium]